MTFRACRRLLTGLTLTLTLALLAGCATQPGHKAGTDRFQEGKAAYLQGEFSRAFELLLREAEDGNPEAQYTVGFMYYHGEGVNEDENAAMRWIKRSANAGNKHAVEALGQLSGIGNRRQQQLGEQE